MNKLTVDIYSKKKLTPEDLALLLFNWDEPLVVRKADGVRLQAAR